MRKKYISNIKYDIALALRKEKSFFGQANIYFTLKDFSFNFQSNNNYLKDVFLNFTQGKYEWISDSVLVCMRKCDEKEFTVEDL